MPSILPLPARASMGGLRPSLRPLRPLRSLHAMLLLSAAPLSAQGTADAPVREALATLRPSALVRVRAPAVHTGAFTALAGDTLVLSESRTSSRILLRDVRTVERSVRQTGRGALIGAVTGGVLLGGLGAIAGAGFCDAADCSNSTARGAGAGLMLGAGSGALIGAGIGSLVRGWRTVYAR